MIHNDSKSFEDKFCGIDYSLSSPAITILSGESIDIHCVYRDKKHLCSEYLLEKDNIKIHFHWIKSTFDSSYEKIKLLSDLFLPLIRPSDFIGMEDYSFGSTGRVFGIAENSGYLKMMIFNSGKSLELFSPKTIKKFASGNGNAKKEDMIDAFEKLLSLDLFSLLQMERNKTLKSPITDIVDSFFIAKLLKETVNK
jgi:Holliday junction resolvasome RuvABC endonuclease subunit